MKIVVFWLKFVPNGGINFAPDNGLVRNNREAIIWSNDGLFY